MGSALPGSWAARACMTHQSSPALEPASALPQMPRLHVSPVKVQSRQEFPRLPQVVSPGCVQSPALQQPVRQLSKLQLPSPPLELPLPESDELSLDESPSLVLPSLAGGCEVVPLSAGAPSSIGLSFAAPSAKSPSAVPSGWSTEPSAVASM